jgi:hypothetical protein
MVGFLEWGDPACTAPEMVETRRAEWFADAAAAARPVTARAIHPPSVRWRVQGCPGLQLAGMREVQRAGGIDGRQRCRRGAACMQI